MRAPRTALRKALRAALRTPLQLGDQSVISRAIAILRSFGSNASSYPFSTRQGAFQTSAGPAAAAVSDPIGLELDGLGTVGAELVTNGDFSAGSTGWGVGADWSITGGVATCTFAASYLTQSYFQSGDPVGMFYAITITATAVSGTVSVGGGVYTSATLLLGTNTYYISRTGTGNNIAYIGGGGGTCSITRISAKQVTGNHATQSTAINRPTLQQDGGGRWYASFNGTNSSLALTSVPFQMAEDFCIVACINPGTQPLDGAIFAITGALATARIQLYISAAAGYAAFYLHDDAAGTSAASGATDIRNTPSVVTLWKVGNTKYLRVNSVQVATDATALGTATFTGAAWGAAPNTSAYFNGGNYEGDAIKGTLTLSQVVTLEKAAGQRAGLVL